MVENTVSVAAFYRILPDKNRNLRRGGVLTLQWKVSASEDVETCCLAFDESAVDGTCSRLRG